MAERADAEARALVQPPGLVELMDRWEAAWSGRDARAFAPLCVAGVQYEDPLTDEPLLGAAAIAAHAERLWAAFPDARIERAGERLHDGRFVAAPVRLAATHRRPLGDVPATNKPVTVHGVFYCETEHGLLRRVRAFFDAYDAAAQLGILPARGSFGARALLVLRGFGLRSRE